MINDVSVIIVVFCYCCVILGSNAFTVDCFIGHAIRIYSSIS